jgi:long-chain acyl-CoA synthetase
MVMHREMPTFAKDACRRAQRVKGFAQARKYLKQKQMKKSFIDLIQKSIHDNWSLDALTDYHGATLRYQDVAREMAELHLLFQTVGIKPGDKVALCGRNSSRWGVVFLATLTYGAVSVPVLHEFKADNIHNIVNHSDAQLLFVGDNVWDNIDERAMPQLKGIVSLTDYRLLNSRSKRLSEAKADFDKLWHKRYPNGYRRENISYRADQPNELAYISYTSGTTSFSKGVMIPYRSLWSNVRFAQDNLPLTPGDGHVCMLPLAHAFGLLFSFLFEFSKGCHIYFLTQTPSPKIILQAYGEVKPSLIISVPLVVEKIIRKNVMPKLQTRPMQLALKLPFVRQRILRSVREKVSAVFGGQFLELVVGGAALNEEVERFLRDIDFPFTVGYGMTECGPLISYASAATFKEKSCGRPVDRQEVKIDSEAPDRIVGEILVRGDNVMQGYYKNPQATAETIDAEGWLHTGDLAVMDDKGNISIKGRSKNMLLGPSGQNIYPEEIEDKLNNLPYVAESIVVQKEGKIVALVHPDYNEAQLAGLKSGQIDALMEDNRRKLNELLPRYCQVASFRLYAEEFEKTPKRSIKRYLYQ